MTQPAARPRPVPSRPTRPTPASPRTTATRSASSAPWSPGEASSTCRTAASSGSPAPDRLTWLHSLTTSTSSALAARRADRGAGARRRTATSSTRSTWSTTAQAVWAHVEPGTAAALVGYLDPMRFCSRVEVDGRCSDVVRRRCVTPRADAAAPSVAACATAARSASSCSCRAPTLAAVLAGPAAGRVGATRRCGSRRAGRGSGFETDHRTIPHEVGWLETAVHLDKGCYRGQETVARVHNLGRPPRRLVLLHLDGSESSCPRTASRCCSAAGRSAASRPRPATTSWGRSRWRWSSGDAGRRDPGRRRHRRRPGGPRRRLTRGHARSATHGRLRRYAA